MDSYSKGLLVIIYLTTPNRNTFYFNGGRILGIIFRIQLVFGIILAIFYIVSFERVILYSRENSWGYLLRWIHSNGARLFFLLIFLHLFRGLFYRSNKKKIVWLRGRVIFVIIIRIAFLGYVLPIGQIRFWGATVITGLIRVLSQRLVVWVWGNYSVSIPTISLFFSLHYLLPFILAIVVLFHIIFLHIPLSRSNSNWEYFHVYFTIKDLINILLFFLFRLLILFSPFILGDPLNFEESNRLSSPIHILPEWYFLWAYAILRGIPDKRLGVLALLGRLILIFIVKGKNYRLSSSILYIISLINLVWLGGIPVEDPFILSAQLTSFIYFFSGGIIIF